MSSWDSETVIKVPNKKVEGWALPEMPGQEYLSSSFASFIWVVTQRNIREPLRDVMHDDTNNRKAAARRKTCVKEASVCTD